MDLVSAVNKIIAPLKRRVQLVVGRGTVKNVSDDKKMQTVQISLLSDEVRDSVERFQEYGFTSHPLAGAEAAAIFLSGNRDNGIVIAVDDRRYRPTTLAPGEVALYNSEGAQIILKASKDIEITGVAKLKVQNAEHELIQVLSDLVQALIDARTNTMQGPQPLLNPGDPFPLIKARLDSFKG